MVELNNHNQLLRVDLQNGAAITHLSLIGGNEKVRSIIEPNNEFKFESSLLFPFPNRLENGVFQFAGKTYQFPLNDFGQPNALHGMTHNMEFECIDKGDDHMTLSLDYRGGISYYPFPFKILVKYALAKGKLNIDIKVNNTGKSSMPCGFGWHPYFNLGDQIESAKLSLSEVVKVEVDQFAIPTGKVTPFHSFDTLSPFADAQLDNCFIFDEGKVERSVYLVYADKSVLDIWQDKHQQFVQVFIHPNKKAIAIEPMTCGINALNTGQGIRVLESGESWDFKLGLRYS